LVTRRISTAGRTDVRLRYQYRTAGMRDADTFVVEWSDGAGWHALRQVSANGGFYPVAVSLPDGAADEDGFALRFRLAGGEQAEVCVDLVRLSGTPLGSEAWNVKGPDHDPYILGNGGDRRLR
jgi:hypothetical protein